GAHVPRPPPWPAPAGIQEASPLITGGNHSGGPTMTRTVTLTGAIALALSCSVLNSHGEAPQKGDKPQKPDNKVKELMRSKLEHAQKVLEAIALNDLDGIAKNAKALRQISERAGWRVFPTPQYLLHSNEFQRVAEKLEKDAKDKSLDGAALSYVELTLNCVRCHKYVREQRMTRADGEARLFAQKWRLEVRAQIP